MSDRRGPPVADSTSEIIHFAQKHAQRIQSRPRYKPPTEPPPPTSTSPNRRGSPTRTSPTRTNPTRSSPTRNSPTRRAPPGGDKPPPPAGPPPNQRARSGGGGGGGEGEGGGRTKDARRRPSGPPPVERPPAASSARQEYETFGKKVGEEFVNVVRERESDRESDRESGSSRGGRGGGSSRGGRGGRGGRSGRGSRGGGLSGRVAGLPARRGELYEGKTSPITKAKGEDNEDDQGEDEGRRRSRGESTESGSSKTEEEPPVSAAASTSSTSSTSTSTSTSSTTTSTTTSSSSSPADAPPQVDKKKKKKKKFGLKLTLDHSDAIATPRPMVVVVDEGKTGDNNKNSDSDNKKNSPTTKNKFKKKNRLGLTLVVEDSNHEPESPKNSPPREGGNGLSVETTHSFGSGHDGEGVQMYDDGRGGNSYGMSDSGTFAIEGFLIRQNGIAEAPGQQHSSPGFGRGGGAASKTSHDGEGKTSSSSSSSSSSSDGMHRDDEGAKAEDELLRLCVLGKGAGGIVYKAVHIPSLRIVAIKKIAVFDQDKRHQMVRELQALYKNLVPIAGAGSSTARGSIREGPCPYIVAFHDAFITPSEGNISIVLEYMDGGSLQDIVDTGGCNLESVLANISYRFLLGINFIHEHHQLHRDIKPSNLLINHHGAVKISDFGIVREMDGTQAKASTFVGTLTYMSPERISGEEYSYASDVWSFGLSLLTVALGRYPLETEGGYWGLLHALKDEASPELPHDSDFSPCFREFIDLCLKKDPKERPTAAALLRHDFLEGCEEQLAQQERDRKSQRQRDLSMSEDGERGGGGEEEDDDEDIGSETARSELDEICELVMDLEYERWKKREEKGSKKATGRSFPRVERAKLAALSDQLGLRLRNVERKFERKWLTLIGMSGDGSGGGGSSRRK